MGGGYMLDDYFRRYFIILGDYFRRDRRYAVILLQVLPGGCLAVVQPSAAEEHLVAEWAVEGVAY